MDEPAQTHPDSLADMRLKREGAKGGLEAIDSAKIAEGAYDKASKYYLEGDVEKALFNLRIALMARPTYLEALRLRERIMAETDPEQFKRLDSIADAGSGQAGGGRLVEDVSRVPVMGPGHLPIAGFGGVVVRGQRSIVWIAAAAALLRCCWRLLPSGRGPASAPGGPTGWRRCASPVTVRGLWA